MERREALATAGAGLLVAAINIVDPTSASAHDVSDGDSSSSPSSSPSEFDPLTHPRSLFPVIVVMGREGWPIDSARWALHFGPSFSSAPRVSVLVERIKKAMKRKQRHGTLSL